MIYKHEVYGLVVCGGGLAGFCAALEAARQGVNTCLIQDRPVLGGNSSSEIRVAVHGAACFHSYARETGIVSELLIEDRALNHQELFENGAINSVWDMLLYDLAVREPNLTLHLNTSLVDVISEHGVQASTLLSERAPANLKAGYAHRTPCPIGRSIKAVIVQVAHAETQIQVEGKLFVDSTGDGVLADLFGCEWRMGSEGRDEFDEPHAPEKPSTDVMGNSIHFKTVNLGRPVPFKPPEWAIQYENADYFYKQGRLPNSPRGGYWWLEIGVPWNTIYDAEDIRHELTRHGLGVWDWMKNRDPKMIEKTRNYALDWIGQVPGKRESRRIIGTYFMAEHDILNRTVFKDEIAFGGWFIDLHTPGGLLAPNSEQSTVDGHYKSAYAAKSYCGPYGIPLRILIAKDCANLLLAGRNVSVTHATLGTVRVMATTALMGQACGAAAAVALEKAVSLHALPDEYSELLQQRLLRVGCFLPNKKNSDIADLALQAQITTSSVACSVGLGPEAQGVHCDLVDWRTAVDRTKADFLSERRAQWIALGCDVGGRHEIERIGVCLSNNGNATKRVKAWLYPVSHIWDYRAVPGIPLAETMLEVPPGREQWLEWEVRLSGFELPGESSYVRLDLDEHPELQWHRAGCMLPGHPSAFQMAPEKMRRYSTCGQTLSFSIAPPQACYEGDQVISGVTRPHAETNLWRSDPASPLPQWLQLDWNRPVQIGTIELTFDGHLLREIHGYPPLYKDPYCAKKIVLETFAGGCWHELARIEENYQRRRVVRLHKPVETRQLRIVILETNGDPSAALYEVRVYS